MHETENRDMSKVMPASSLKKILLADVTSVYTRLTALKQNKQKVWIDFPKNSLIFIIEILTIPPNMLPKHLF